MSAILEKKRVLLSGNEAIAHGAMEAGISYAVSYPGTPATEILEYLSRKFNGKAEWAVNEKIAYETAIGVSYTGRRVLCSMKHVGLNVASDPLMTSAYLGVKGGVTLVVADDPGAYSSQNEQDSRYYAKFAKIPCIEPGNAQEAKDMVIQAFDLSEKFGLPVMVRSVTRLSHSCSPVELGENRSENPLNLVKDPKNMVAVPSNVNRLHTALNKKQEELINWGEKSGLNKVFKNGQSKGIIGCGIGAEYAKEQGDKYALLKISFYPFPERLVEEFVRGLDEVWVFEEGEPIVEEIARRYSINVHGKLSAEIKREGELGPDIFSNRLSKEYSGIQVNLPGNLPPRPPVLCAGCPHREVYIALKGADPLFTTGDIGCYTLGANAPLNALDTCLCMGAGISQAVGIANQGVKRVVAVIGDSTFLHSGVPALINAVYNNANILVMILDNSSTAMTGHQPTPLTGKTAQGGPGGQVNLEDLCRSCGVASVEVVNPYKVEDSEKVIEQKLATEGVHVIISRGPCLFVRK